MNYTKLCELVKVYEGMSAEQIAAALAGLVEINCDFRLSYQSALDACGLAQTRTIWWALEDAGDAVPLDDQCDEFVFAIQNGYEIELNTVGVGVLLKRLFDAKRLPLESYELLKSFTRKTITRAEKEGVAGVTARNVASAMLTNSRGVQQ